MKKAVVFCVIVIIGAAFYFMPRQKPMAYKPVIKIGAILPLTGNMAMWGQAYKSGMILAIERIPSDTKFQYELVFEDAGDTTKNLPAIASKLINIDKVQSVITLFDPTANVIAPILMKYKMIHMGASWFPKFIGNPYSFNFYASMAEESDLIVQKSVHEGYKNVVLFTAIHTGFVGGTKILKDKLQDANISVCCEINYHFGQKDFRMDIAKMQQECHPDLVIIGGFPPETDLIIRQFSGNPTPITGLDLGLNVGNAVLYEGMWFPAPALPNDVFINDYVSRFQKDDYLFGAGIAFDEINVLIEAYENTPTTGTNPTSDEVSNYIHTKKHFTSAFGTIVVEENGQVTTPSMLITIRDGKAAR